MEQATCTLPRVSGRVREEEEKKEEEKEEKKRRRGKSTSRLELGDDDAVVGGDAPDSEGVEALSVTGAL